MFCKTDSALRTILRTALTKWLAMIICERKQKNPYPRYCRYSALRIRNRFATVFTHQYYFFKWYQHVDNELSECITIKQYIWRTTNEKERIGNSVGIYLDSVAGAFRFRRISTWWKCPCRWWRRKYDILLWGRQLYSSGISSKKS